MRVDMNFFSVNGIYNNLIFKVIYSFHMPLFACISGWLFGSTIEKYASCCSCTPFFGDNIGIYLLSIAGMLVIPDSEIFSGGAQEQNLIHKIISAIGRESIGIYILSSKIISGVCYSVFKAERVNYILDIILTVGILVICHAAIYIIKKVPLANKMLLGGI